ncbi:MAG: RluA family pseudouridine synthase [Candidatus Margulisiibacteriota bacterium]
MEKFELTVAAEQVGRRLDQALADNPAPPLSRSRAKGLIDSGNITVNEEAVAPSYKLKANDRIKITLPPPVGSTVNAEKIPLEIVYEDDQIIVVNKPKGMVTHPAPGHYSGTLVNALLAHCDHLAATGAPLRPGIVHRLDKDTSGLIVVAKTDPAYYSLIKQFKDRTVEKTYFALAQGIIKNDQGVIEASIGRHPVNRKKMTVVRTTNHPSPSLGTSESRSTKGRAALTEYRVLKRFKKHTLVEVKIKTGRTHQIRVHLSHLGYPLVGDPTYGGQKNTLGVTGQMLHAGQLKFVHPLTGEKLEFTAALPVEFRAERNW